MFWLSYFFTINREASKWNQTYGGNLCASFVYSENISLLKTTAVHHITRCLTWWDKWLYGDMHGFSWTNVIILVRTSIHYIFWNKLTVRCCRQWLVWPTGRWGGRHGVWRTVQTHDAFDQHHPSMRNTFSYQLGKCWPDQIQKWSASHASTQFASLNVSNPYYLVNQG